MALHELQTLLLSTVHLLQIDRAKFKRWAGPALQLTNFEGIPRNVQDQACRHRPDGKAYSGHRASTNTENCKDAQAAFHQTLNTHCHCLTPNDDTPDWALRAGNDNCRVQQC